MERSIKLIDWLRLGIAVLVAKTVTLILRSLHLGAASVLPGSIARFIAPGLLEQFSHQVKSGIILITGTNGKTTTSLLLRGILECEGYRVAHNSTGANLENGLATALVESSNLLGKLDVDYAILEVDENIVSKVIHTIQPDIILCLNLFRDQLDRYGEVDKLSKCLNEAITNFTSDAVVILNADDPILSYIGQQINQKVYFFGLTEPEHYLESMPHAVDSIYCPNCGHALEYQGVYLSHLGDFTCPSCSFSRSEPTLNSQEWEQVLIGLYNKYNTMAAVTAAQELGVGIETTKFAVKAFQAAFGRAEELEVNGKRVRILLSKNPVGTNETIRVVTESGDTTTLFVLNDHTQDGKDISWIWDVDTEKLVERGGTVVVSGNRVYDMALRLQYSQDSQHSNINLIVEPDLYRAITTALEKTPAGRTLHILPTYTAMLDVRKILTGSKIR
ncbi:proposed amino acid ligase found clustered with an amidotransferase [Richelia intracellularis HM01]|uniref:Mur ligase family protein n=1 Tax=Richelia intracellularis TaxID=1164990 RepID=UPI0002B521C3|nr:Mur ligase family protein [Richelia intracellularis]CCH65903.1 proposed amino acid ligase found clustered with an amidotransferase [Richelia intracellularis HM01]